jgi:hypothetical protein
LQTSFNPDDYSRGFHFLLLNPSPSPSIIALGKGWGKG